MDARGPRGDRGAPLGGRGRLQGVCGACLTRSQSQSSARGQAQGLAGVRASPCQAPLLCTVLPGCDAEDIGPARQSAPQWTVRLQRGPRCTLTLTQDADISCRARWMCRRHAYASRQTSFFISTAGTLSSRCVKRLARRPAGGPWRRQGRGRAGRRGRRDSASDRRQCDRRHAHPDARGAPQPAQPAAARN